MRPKSVIRAEWLYLAAIAVQPVVAGLVWQATVAAYGLGLAVGDLAFTMGVWLLLLLLSTRRGSGGARVVLLVLTALTLAWRAVQLTRFGVVDGAPNLLLALQAGLMAAGGVLLLRSDARDWFAAPRAPDDEDAEVAA